MYRSTARAGFAWTILLLGAVAFLGAASPSAAATFVITPGEPNLVVFESKATLESFQGKTRQVSGTITVDPAGLADSAAIEVTVDLASLDTGIAVRNKHMREEHLETDKYPKAVFRGGKLLEVSKPALAAGQSVTFKISGEFSLHGVTLPLVVPVTVTMAPETSSMRIQGAFDVRLPDYHISRPQFLVMRLNETQHITLDLTAKTK
jgi:polyisoprenoid-binding protein YceI